MGPRITLVWIGCGVMHVVSSIVLLAVCSTPSAGIRDATSANRCSSLPISGAVGRCVTGSCGDLFNL